MRTSERCRYGSDQGVGEVIGGFWDLRAGDEHQAIFYRRVTVRFDERSANRLVEIGHLHPVAIRMGSLLEQCDVDVGLHVAIYVRQDDFVHAGIAFSAHQVDVKHDVVVDDWPDFAHRLPSRNEQRRAVD